VDKNSHVLLETALQMVLFQTTLPMTKQNPQHYKTNGIEVWDYIHQNDLCYFKGNVLKYIIRAGAKPGESELDDLRKASVYLNKLISIKENEKPRSTSDRVQDLYDAAAWEYDPKDPLFTDPFDR